MSIRILKNGTMELLPYVLHDETGRKSLDGELFTKTIVFDTKTKPNYAPYSIVEVDGEKWLLSDHNHNSEIKPIGEQLYRCPILLVELTKILEYFTLSACSFCNQENTLYQQFQKALYKAEVKYIGENHRFIIDDELKTMLESKPAEDFRYPTESTLREALDDMLSGLNYRIFVADISNDYDVITLGYLDLARKNPIQYNNSFEFKEKGNQFAEYYAANYETNIRNAITKNRVPVNEKWTTLKPIDGTLADTNSVRLLTQFPIEELTQIIVRYQANIKHQLRNPLNGSMIYGTDLTEEDIMLNVDVTDIFVEREIYDAMDYTEQQKHIPFARGSKDIGVISTYKKLFFTREKFRERLLELSVEVAEEILQNLGVWRDNDVVVEIFFDNPYLDIYQQVLFSVSYVPYLDLHFKVGKLVNDVAFQGSIISNQIDRTIDVNRYSNHLQALANKLGNKELIKSVEQNRNQPLLELGDLIDDNYSLINIDYVKDNVAVKANYTFVQNYDVVLNTRISRERRLFNIPAEELIERDVLIKNYLIASLEKAPINNGLLNDETATKYFLKTFKNNDSENKPINRVIFQTTDGSNNYGLFSLPLLGTAIGRSMHWKFKMLDNYSVGLSLNTQVIGGKSVFLNPYVNENGEFASITLSLIRDDIEGASYENQLIIGKSLPKIPFQMHEVYIDVDYSAGGKSLIISKDKFEALSFSYQLETKPSDIQRIVIGDYLVKYSTLLFGLCDVAFFVYGSETQTYKPNENQSCKGNILTYPISIDTSDMSIKVNGELRGLKSWAIGDPYRNLVIAVNNNNQQTDEVFFTISRE